MMKLMHTISTKGREKSPEIEIFQDFLGRYEIIYTSLTPNIKTEKSFSYRKVSYIIIGILLARIKQLESELKLYKPK